MICKITRIKTIKRTTWLPALLMVMLCVTVTAMHAQEPGAPTGLQATDGTANEFTLNWDPDALATGFNIGIVGNNGEDIWIVSQTGTSYTFTGTYGTGASQITIVDGKTYRVKLQALPDNDGNAYAHLDVTVNAPTPSEPLDPTGLVLTQENPNEFILTWDYDPLAYDGFNVGIVGADDTDIWIEYNYKGETSYKFSGTYGSGTAAEITISDGQTYIMKLQALPDTNWDAYSQVSTETLSTNRINEIDFNVAPNPVSEVISIHGDANTLNNISKISVYAPTGQLIKESKAFKIEASKLNPGLYLVLVEDQNGHVTTKKFIKN